MSFKFGDIVKKENLFKFLCVFELQFKQDTPSLVQ